MDAPGDHVQSNLHGTPGTPGIPIAAQARTSRYSLPANMQRKQSTATKWQDMTPIFHENF